MPEDSLNIKGIRVNEQVPIIWLVYFKEILLRRLFILNISRVFELSNKSSRPNLYFF